jgi:hypothetical protein
MKRNHCRFIISFSCSLSIKSSLPLFVHRELKSLPLFYLQTSVLVYTKEWALLFLLLNSTGGPLAFPFAWVDCLFLLFYRFWYLIHILITCLIGYISRTGCRRPTNMFLAKQDMHIFKKLGSLFSKLHMTAFNSFLRIVASLKLNNKN